MWYGNEYRKQVGNVTVKVRLHTLGMSTCNTLG